MRVLILSCNTGEGHNSAAKAIGAQLEAQAVEYEIVDALAFISEKVSDFISGWHVRIYQHVPALFNIGYRVEEITSPRPKDTSALYRFLSKGAENLYEYIQKGGFDRVVSTHAFASLIMRRVKQDHKDAPDQVFVATDYTCSPFVAECQADMYMIPDEKLMQEFLQCGIARERILPTGIPVGEVFHTPRNKEKSKEALGLPKEKRVALLMCGSMGCGPIRQLARELVDRIPKDTVLVVICGHNKKLYEDMQALANRENFRAVGYTRQMPLYMDAAELIITKPGGLSSTEAAAKRLPMFFINAVGGCEGRNLEFYRGNGLACGANDVKALVQLVVTKLETPGALDRMRKALEKNFPHHGAKEISDYVLTKM